MLLYNNDRFMAKELRKAIMLRSKLKNILNKDKTHFNWQKYKYFAKLNVKDDIKTILKTILKNKMQKLDVKKSSTFRCILVTILKDCLDVYLIHLTNSVNHSLQLSVFPQKLNQAEVFPLHKKDRPIE